MLDRRIKFRHIQCFVEIVRQQSMKRAAERLHLTQPAISKTLKELEEIIGWCQTDSNQSLHGQDLCPLFRAKTTPLGESGCAVLLETGS